jgi:hypothetical protein
MKKPSLYLLVKNELFLLYLKGIRGLAERPRNKIPSYNFYSRLMSLGFTLLTYGYIKKALKFVIVCEITILLFKDSLYLKKKKGILLARITE